MLLMLAVTLFDKQYATENGREQVKVDRQREHKNKVVSVGRVVRDQIKRVSPIKHDQSVELTSMMRTYDKPLRDPLGSTLYV